METIIGGTKFIAKYEGDNKVIIWHSRGHYIIWQNGKWADDNKGKSYLGWQAREILVKAFNLK